MALSTQSKGNIAETAIQLELERMKPLIQNVIAIANQDDSNHADLFAYLDKGTVFAVQVKHLSEKNLALKMSHINDWLRSKYLTVPIWWDEVNKKAYWADILAYLIRTGGIRERKTAKFNLQADLRELNIHGGTADFLVWIQALTTLWPKLVNDGLDAWALDPQFPVSLVDIAANPEILLFLPVNAQLIHTLQDTLGPLGENRIALAGHVFAAGAKASKVSPQIAARELAGKFITVDSAPEIVDELTSALSQWTSRINAERKIIAANTLAAFGQVISIMGYQNVGDLKVPAFDWAHTYPVRHLLTLLPVDVVGRQLDLILTKEVDPDTLLHAANYYGVLNWPKRSNVWKHVRTLKDSIRGRKVQIGPQWRAVHRQLHYSEAQLGSEEAKASFIRALIDKEGHMFDNAYVFKYQGGESNLVLSRFATKFDEKAQSDENVMEILEVMYNSLRKKISENLNLTSPEARFWPID